MLLLLIIATVRKTMTLQKEKQMRQRIEIH
ncbi:hypothetical protein FLLO111716_01710 [Flavobacterium longum]